MEFDFYEELKKKMNIEELDTDTLYYQISLFLDACGFDMKKGGYGNSSTDLNYGINFCQKSRTTNSVSYTIQFINEKKDNKHRRFITKGYYNDLVFELDSHYKKNILDGNLRHIPFSIHLEKPQYEQNYFVDIESLDNYKTKFSFERKPFNENEQSSKMVFYSHRTDLENVYEIIKHFVQKPQEVYSTYMSVMAEKEVYFNGNEIDLMKEHDELIINRDGNAYKKVLKK